jgi:hypothetical protein
VVLLPVPPLHDNAAPECNSIPPIMFPLAFVVRVLPVSSGVVAGTLRLPLQLSTPLRLNVLLITFMAMAVVVSVPAVEVIVPVDDVIAPDRVHDAPRFKVALVTERVVPENVAAVFSVELPDNAIAPDEVTVAFEL